MEGLNKKMLKTEERFSVAAEATVTETQAVTHRPDIRDHWPGEQGSSGVILSRVLG